MRFNQRFIHGRLRRRMLRAPAIEGWLADELAQKPPERADLALKKIEGDCLALPIPETGDLARLSPAATEAATTEALAGEVEILIGWPETLVLVRRGRVLIHAEGDVVHFGRLALDGRHALERTGYQYLAETGIEVRAELALYEGETARRELLDPDSRAILGPYEIDHQHSFDPSDRPSGARQHGYAFTVRLRGLPPPAPATDAPHPLDVAEPGPVLELARQRGLLGFDEALAGEPAAFARLLDRYEGPRPKLEEAVRAAVPGAATLSRLGDTVVVQSAHLARGEHGEPRHGRASLALDPTGGLTITRAELGTYPGRLRKTH